MKRNITWSTRAITAFIWVHMHRSSAFLSQLRFCFTKKCSFISILIFAGVCISRHPVLCLAPVLAPNLYLPALAYNFITSPGPEFAHTNLVSSICICIKALAYDLYYRSGAWICIYLIIGSSSSGSSNSSSSNLFGINNTNICMPILINQGKQTEACAQTGC